MANNIVPGITIVNAIAVTNFTAMDLTGVSIIYTDIDGAYRSYRPDRGLNFFSATEVNKKYIFTSSTPKDLTAFFGDVSGGVASFSDDTFNLPL